MRFVQRSVANNVAGYLKINFAAAKNCSYAGKARKTKTRSG
ncbi:hypothetical protein [Campylobacter rectus]|nr:hypothetical protein [Campylobacter rectus]